MQRRLRSREPGRAGRARRPDYLAGQVFAIYVDRHHLGTRRLTTAVKKAQLFEYNAGHAETIVMSCIHGRVRPTSATQRRLFAASAGVCQNPGCRTTLFPDNTNNDITIGEIAHIIAAVPEGPRSDESMNATDRATFENLILLCPNCHTIVDKDADSFPAALLQAWKAEHAAGILAQFGAPIVSSRVELRELISPLLAENRHIHQNWGPDLDYQFDPEAGRARVWKRKMRATIIPNSERMILLLEANRTLLRDGEVGTLAAFRQHVHDLTDKHVLKLNGVASRFPEGINTICR